MDFWELFSEVDSVFISVVFEVVPEATIEDYWIRFLSFGRGKDEEVVSLFVLWITSDYTCDAGISCLWGIRFEVCNLVFVKPKDGFCFLCSPSSVMERAMTVLAECPMLPAVALW